MDASVRQRLNELRSVVSANLDDARGMLFDGRKRRRLAEILTLLAEVRRGRLPAGAEEPLETVALIDELADIHDLTVGTRNGPALADQAIATFRRATAVIQPPEDAMGFMFRGMAYCLSTAIALVALLIYWNGYSSLAAPLSTPTVPILSAVAGAAGAMVSMAMRIGKSDMPAFWTPNEMVLKGAMRPLIGAAIGVFSYAVIKGKLIPIDVGTGEAQLYAFLAIAFASGFGERVQVDAANLLSGRGRRDASEDENDTSKVPEKAPGSRAKIPASPATPHRAPVGSQSPVA